MKRGLEYRLVRSQTLGWGPATRADPLLEEGGRAQQAFLGPARQDPAPSRQVEGTGPGQVESRPTLIPSCLFPFNLHKALGLGRTRAICPHVTDMEPSEK